MVKPISIEGTISNTPHHTSFCSISPDNRNTSSRKPVLHEKTADNESN